MLKIFRILLIPCFLILVHFSHAQWRDYHFTTKDAKDGLTSNIFDIVQDSIGYIYFGTGQGLIRYDGKVFSPFYHNPKDSTTIGPGDVWELQRGLDGKIWVGLRFGGLNVFYPKKATFERFPLPKLYADDLPSVNAILEEGKLVWVGASHFRLHLFDSEKKEYETYSPNWPNINLRQKRLSIISIIQDKGNSEILWLSVLGYHPPGAPEYKNMGVVQFNKSTKKFISQPCDCKLDFQDENGVLWGKSYGGGIWKYNPQLRECESTILSIEVNREIQPVIHDLYEEKEFIWVSSTYAISKFSKLSNKLDIIIKGEELETVTKIYKDREENIWFGRSNGLHVIDKKQQHIRFYSMDEFGIKDRIYPGMLAFDKQKESLFFSNYRDKIYQIPLDEEKSTASYSHNTRVNSIVYTEKDSLYFVADGKLNVMANGLETSPTNIYNSLDLSGVWKMTLTQNGQIGAIGSNKFIWFKPEENSFKQVSISELAEYKTEGPGFEDFSITNNGNAIIHSENIYHINLANGISTKYHLDPTLNPDQLEIRSVVQDDNNNYWISLPNRIARFELRHDSLHLIRSFSSVDGLESQWYDELFKDYQGRIWAFSSNGIDCIDPNNNEIRSFGLKDGLPSHVNDPVQVIEVSDHQIASVCSNGIIVFHPDSLWHNATNYEIPVLIKSITIDGAEVVSDSDPNFISEIIIQPNDKMLNIEFQGLALPVDDYLVYSYQLVGQEEQWIHMGKTNQIAFQNLSPGKYVFNVKAGDINANGPVKSVRIYVQPAFYETSWFSFLVAFILATLAYLFYKYRINLIKEREAQKSLQMLKMAELELVALRSQMNPHFMFNSLNSIKNFILQSKPHKAAEYLSNFAHLLRMILQNSREKTISLKNEIDSLILYLELEKIRFEDQFDYSFEMDGSIDMESVQIPPMILQPYIENAIWHGLNNKKGKGNLLLKIEKEKNAIKCIIDDDGVGRAEALKIKNSFTRKYKSLGMGITKDRIDILNKLNSMGIDVEIIDKMDDSGEALGTRIVVRVPSNSSMQSSN